MNEQTRLDFLSALGDEFCDVLGSILDGKTGLCPQVAFEVFAKVLGKDFSVDSLRHLSLSQVEELRESASSLIEDATITESHLREVVRRTLARW